MISKVLFDVLGGIGLLIGMIYYAPRQEKKLNEQLKNFKGIYDDERIR